jgi:hypothetical protein
MAIDTPLVYVGVYDSPPYQYVIHPTEPASSSGTGVLSS